MTDPAAFRVAGDHLVVDRPGCDPVWIDLSRMLRLRRDGGEEAARPAEIILRLDLSKMGLTWPEIDQAIALACERLV